MKKYFFLILFLPVAAFSQNDEASVKQVVTSAYVEGIHNRGSIDDIRKGFHPSFNMLRLMDNEIKPLPIEEWITMLEKTRKEAPTTPARTEGKFINVDVTGNNAVVKLELYRENKKVFTDYLVLYKFTEGWRVVSKTFYRHS
jgi:hypothetical protein